jgi:alkylation response protein AidB-like acyl-CoA dehydrogenase
MGGGAFPINMRDIRFVLYEQLGVERLCERDRFKDFCRETFDMVLEEGAKLAAEVIAPVNVISDKEGCTFAAGKVRVPAAFHEAFRKFAEGGWIAATVDAEAGGQGLPESLAVATTEMFVGACCSFSTYPTLTLGAANLIRSFGSAEQKKIFLEKMYRGQWTGTMCLTEPQAGSAVGDIQTVARREGDHYLLQGTKIFITAGEHDLAENIIHAVLARTENAAPGIRGLSLFIVPKIRIRPDGSLGEPNDVICSGVEHKMGIKGSATCTLNFGEDSRCRASILGQEGQGIQQMFQMMNEARLLVGMQGFALGNAAYLYALQYAKERIQGVEIERTKEPGAPRIPIIKHPDIRRMLLMMKAYTEGLRALLYRTAYYIDLARVAQNPLEKEKWNDRVDLLIPICKAYSTDLAFRLTEWAIQIFGGYGYCGEYPVEQFCRDVKITSIYEGTNGIQAMDLVGRKLSLKRGALFMGWLEEINDFIEKYKAHYSLGPRVAQLEQVKNALGRVTLHFAKLVEDGDRLYPMLQATPYLELFGDVALAYLLLDQARVADEKLQLIFEKSGAKTEAKRAELMREQSEAAFYSGKLHAAEFFISHIHSRVQGTANMILSGNRSALQIPDGAF